MTSHRYGVIAEPEWSGWLNLYHNDSYLIIASDGVFEKLTTDNVCRALSAVQSGMDASVALGLVREPAIALPPRKEPEFGSRVKESLEPSRYAPYAFCLFQHSMGWRVITLSSQRNRK